MNPASPSLSMPPAQTSVGPLSQTRERLRLGSCVASVHVFPSKWKTDPLSLQAQTSFGAMPRTPVRFSTVTGRTSDQALPSKWTTVPLSPTAHTSWSPVPQIERRFCFVPPRRGRSFSFHAVDSEPSELVERARTARGCARLAARGEQGERAHRKGAEDVKSDDECARFLALHGAVSLAWFGHGFTPDAGASRALALEQGPPMSTPGTHPYAAFVHLVQKPARYLGRRVRRASARTGRRVDARVCLAFPDVYDIGMSHLGFKILYTILNDDPRTLAERAYAPWVDMEARAARARAAARVARERAAAPRLRRRRLLAPVRAHVHERAHDARSRRHPAARRAIAARTIRSSSPAARRRRTPSRSRRSSTRSSSATARSARPRSRSRGRELQGGGRAARRAAARARASCRGVYVPSLYATTRRSRHRASTVVDRAARRPSAPLPGRAHARRRSEPLPVPRRRPGRRTRGDLRPHVDRDRARLHRGLPLLPGRDDLPPGARARSRADRRHGRAAP